MLIPSIGHHKKNRRTIDVFRPAGAHWTLSIANDSLGLRPMSVNLGFRIVRRGLVPQGLSESSPASAAADWEMSQKTQLVPLGAIEMSESLPPREFTTPM
jgi:hypothetical protein